MFSVWSVATDYERIAARARLFAAVRAFMDERGIMEVDTPVLATAGNPDPNVQPLVTRVSAPDRPHPVACYLHTSPEFFMKRLLAAGSGPIYQLSHVFRDRETGRHHQPEFTMLEWYRPGYDHHRLMEEVQELLATFGVAAGTCSTYGDVFKDATGLDPHQVDVPCLVRRAAALGYLSEPPEAGVLTDFLFSELAAPKLGREGADFVFDFPVQQAALARIRDGSPPVAERFEVFINGMEIANGFHELTDPAEQRRRFEDENRRRGAAGLPAVPVDAAMLEALENLPPCAGVALGVDRLLMVLARADRVEDVLAFPFGSAG